MASPTPAARAALDEYIKQLAKLGDGLTLEDFRLDRIKQAQRTVIAVRRTLYMCGLLFMAAAVGDLVRRNAMAGDGIVWIGIWALSLGGLGAIASIFLHVLKLQPQETLQSSDEFEVIGRIFLGCLFSLVLGLALIPDALLDFFSFFSPECHVKGATCTTGGAKLLLPFLCGYSIPLVLGLLEKAIRAIELTIGLDGRRTTGGKPTRR